MILWLRNSANVCELWISVDDQPVDLELELVLLVVVHRDVVLRRAGLALTVLQEHEPDHPSGHLLSNPLSLNKPPSNQSTW